MRQCADGLGLGCLTGGFDVQHRKQHAKVHTEKGARQTSHRQTERGKKVILSEGYSHFCSFNSFTTALLYFLALLATTPDGSIAYT